MAKHNVGATSALCKASGHDWRPGLADNYRQCALCRSTEMKVHGEWLPPTRRVLKKRDEAVPSGPSLIDVGQDLRAKIAPLVDLPEPKPAVAPGAQSGDEYLRQLTRRNRAEMLLALAGRHGYPQFDFIFGLEMRTVPAGEEAWRSCVPFWRIVEIDAAIEALSLHHSVPGEETRRLELIEVGRARHWQRFIVEAKNAGTRGAFGIVLDGGEIGWSRFAYSGSFEHVCQALEQLNSQKL